MQKQFLSKEISWNEAWSSSIVMLLSPRLCIEIEDQVVAYLLRFMHVISERNAQEIEGELRIHVNKYFFKQ